ncbi:MAG: tetratricopeptide repeat protein [Pseudomonadota bacterium]
MTFLGHKFRFQVVIGLTWLFAASFLANPSIVHAQLEQADSGERYRSCLENAYQRPEDTFEMATGWIGEGGAEHARHCAAIALIELGHYGVAAQRLEDLVKDLPEEKLDFQSTLLAQAGQSWLLAGDLDRAYRAQTAALQGDPTSVQILTDRGITLASAGHYGEAVDDFTQAILKAPGNSEIFVYRASAYRYLGEEGLAAADLETALANDPENPDALLERGILRRLSGDEAGAREDWVRAAVMGEGTPTGELAQRNIEKLDLNLD